MSGSAVYNQAGQDARLSSVAKMQAALEKAGVEFIAENGGGAGVRMKKRRKAEK
jgi:hypothetical protein